MKRILSFVLCIMILCTLLPVSALAEEAGEDSAGQLEEPLIETSTPEDAQDDPVETPPELPEEPVVPPAEETEPPTPSPQASPESTHPADTSVPSPAASSEPTAPPKATETPDPEKSPAPSVHQEAALRQAIDSQQAQISVSSDVIFTADLLIPEGISVTFEANVQLKTGVSLTNEGTVILLGDAEIAGTVNNTEKGIIQIGEETDSEHAEVVFLASATLYNEGVIDLYGTLQFEDTVTFADDQCPIILYASGRLEGCENYLTADAEEPAQWSESHGTSGEETPPELPPESVSDTQAYNSSPSDFSYNVLGENAIIITGYSGSDTVIDIPATIDGYIVQKVGSSAFENNTAITQVTLPENVLSINDEAFRNCSNLVSVSLPSSLTTIGEAAFWGCSKLASIALPDSVSTIKWGAFYECSSLSSINYPKSWTGTSYSYSKSSVFYGCTNLVSITVPEGVTSIPGYAFSGSNCLKSIVLPSTLETIDKYAFYGCEALSSIAIPENVTAINSYAFSGCSNLTSVSITSDITSISDSVFQNCTSLVSVSLPDNLTTIGEAAFRGCSKLASIALPDSVSTIKWGAFYECSSLSSINYPKSWTGTSYSYSKSSIFYGCTKLVSITVPEGVTSIPSYAFSGSNCLRSIVLPSTLETIDKYAFYECEDLSSIVIPENVTAINSYAFYGCSNLTRVSISDGITSISDSMFRNCTSLASVSLPDNLTTIGDSAFWGCSSLASIALPDSVHTIRWGAFYDCYSLRNINFPKNWTATSWSSSKSSIFYGCTRLISITVPEGVTSIPAYAFSGSNCLKSIVLPSTLETINKYAFYECTALSSITIPSNVTAINDHAFYGCSKLASISIPANITTLSDYVFQNCTNLASVSLPGNLTTIGDSAFRSCSKLTSIVLPDSVSTIKWGAFYECSNLSSVNYPRSLTSTYVSSSKSSIFYGCTKLVSITVPEGVTSIPSNVFAGSNTLKTVRLPSTLNAIPQYAFYNCTALEQIVLPVHVQTIGYNSFTYCSALEKIWIGANTTSIDSSAFYYCNALTIHGAAGSSAEAFAAGKGISFSAEPLTERIYQEMTGTISGGAGILVRVWDDTDGVLIGNLTTSATGDYRFQALAGHSITVSVTHSLYSFQPASFQTTITEGQTSLPVIIATEKTDAETDGSDFSYSKIDSTTISITAYNGSDLQLVIPQMIDGYTVRQIGESAFYNTNIREVKIPSTVNIIKSYAFQGCTRLTSVTLPETLTTISYSAFRGCTGLTSVVLPDSVTTIESYAFYYCSNLASVNYPVGWKTTSGSSGGNIFTGTQIESFVIPEGIVSIPTYAFAGCSNLTSITLPSTLERIPEGAFYGCKGLTEIELPDIVKVIDYSAFRGCSGLESVTLPEALTTISNSAFRECTGLTSVVLPDSVTAIESYAFYYCSNLASVNYPIGWKTTSESSSGSIFMGTQIESFGIPEGIVTIPTYAFAGCSNLTSITLPSTLEHIPEGAFYGCTGLTEIKLPDTLKGIDDSAFRGCTELTSVTIPEAVTAIPYSAFRGCTGLTSIALSDNVESIGDYAYADCVNLKSISIGKDTVVSSNAFSGVTVSGVCGTDMAWTIDCATRQLSIEGSGEMRFNATGGNVPWEAFRSFVTVLTVQSGITSIGNEAFRGMRYISSITIPDGVKVIGNYALADCTSLKKANVSRDLETLGRGAFSGCTALEELVFYGPFPSIGADAIPSSKQLTVFYPESSTAWSDYLRLNCPESARAVWDDTLSTRDIVLVLDVSGSMDGSRIASLRTAITAFLDKIGGKMTNSRVALITYNANATLRAGFSSNMDELKALANSLTSGGGTEYLEAMTAAEALLLTSHADVRGMIIFSDGEPNDSIENIREKAAELNEEFSMYTVGFMPTNSSKQLLIEIAGSASRYYEASDITQLVDSFIDLAGDAGNEVEVDTSNYYVTTDSKLFRIRAYGSSYPSPAGFDVEIDGNVYNSGATECTGTDDISIDIPSSYQGDVRFSRDGYYTYQMPRALLQSYNLVAMIPTTVKTPFVQSLMLETKTKRYRSLDNVLLSLKSVHEAQLTSTNPKEGHYNIYVDVNWNGHEEGTIWLQQGTSKITLQNHQFTDADLGHVFNAKNGAIYLYTKGADGNTYRTGTCIEMCGVQQKIGANLGDSISIDGADISELTVLGDDAFEIDFSDLSDDVIPLKFEIKEDGSIIGTIGLGAEGTDTQSAYGTISEAFAAWKRHDDKDKEMTKLLKEMQKYGPMQTTASFGFEAEMQLVGIFTGNYLDGRLGLTEVQIALIVSGKVTYTQQFVVLGVPAYVKFSLAAEITASLEMKYNDKLGSLIPEEDTQLEAKLTLSGELGTGWHGFISGGFKGSGSVNVDTVLPLDYDKATMYLQADFAVTGTFLGLEGEWTIKKTPKYVFFENGTFMHPEARDKFALQEFKPYLLKPGESASHFFASAEGKAVLADGFTLLKTNTSMFSDPQLAVLPDGAKLLVWVDYAAGRGVIDAHAVYYSYFDGDTWSSPAIVDDDGTNDYQPLVYLEDGKPYVVWHDYTTVFGDTYDTIEDVASQVDISVAVFDTASRSMTGIHTFTNPGYDYSPRMTSIDGRLAVAWKNGAEDPVMFSSYLSSGVWTTPSSASPTDWYRDNPTELPADFDGELPSVAIPPKYLETETYRCILFIGNDGGNADNIFGVFNDGTEWGDYIQLTELPDGEYVERFSAQVDSSGNLIIVANIRDGEELTDESKLGYFTYDVSNSIEVTYADYERLTLSQDGEISFYADVLNCSPYNIDTLKIRLLDNNGTVLKSQLATNGLKSGHTDRLYINYKLPDDYADSTVTVKVIPVNSDDGNETDNSYVCNLYETDISVEETIARCDGTQTAVTVRIVNRGRTETPATDVAIRKGKPDGEILYTEKTTALQPNGVYVLRCTLNELDENTVIYVSAADVPDENLYGNNTAVANVISAYTVSSVKLNKSSLALYTLDSYTLTASVLPIEIKKPSLTWISSDESVATVDTEGTVTAKGSGSCVITVTAIGGESASCEVTVEDMTGIRLSPSKSSIRVGEECIIAYDFVNLPTNPSGVQWSSQNTAVATVDSNGHVRGISVGQAIIRATANEDSSMYAEATITVLPVLITGIEIRGSAIVGVNRTETYQVFVTPSNATNKTFVWSIVDGSEYISLNKTTGTVTGLAVGTATLRATANDGSGVYCDMDVRVLEFLTLASVTPSKAAAFVGDTIKWTPNVSGGSGTKQYYYMLYKDGVSIKVWNWSAEDTCSYTLTQPGTYYLRVRIKDGEEARSEWVNSAATVVTEKIKLNSVAASKTRAFVGDTVTWTPNVSNGEGAKSYYYMLYKDGGLFKVWNWSAEATCSYALTQTGTYYLRVRVMDGNEVRSEWVNSANTVVKEKIKLNSVTPSKASAFVGDTVTWTPSVSNGEGAKSYYYMLFRDGVSVKTWSWSTEATCSYALTQTGTYYLRVRVMDGNEVRSEWVNSANTVVKEKIKLNSVTPGKASAFVGDTVTWTPNVSNGEGEKSYYYMLYKDGASIKVWSWSAEATCSYTMTETGTYYLRVRVMDGNEVRSEWVNSANTVVTEKIRLNSVTPGKVSAFVGDTVTWTPDVSNGEGEKSYYYILYKDDALFKVWNWSAEDTCSYSLTQAGVYYLRVRVMDGNEVRSEWVNSATTLVKEKITINSVTPGKVSAFVGDTVTWTPNVSNGEGEKSYYYMLYKDGVLLKAWSWSAEDTCSFTMTQAGTYYLRARVKDGNEVRSEWVNSANTVVKQKIKLNSVTPGKVSAFVGDTVTWTPSVSNGEGEKSYYYMLYKDGASIKVWSWSAEATCSYTMTETGTYYLRVRVMDGYEVRSEWVNSANTVVKEKIKLNSVTPGKVNAFVGDTVTWTPDVSNGEGEKSYYYMLYKDGVSIKVWGWSTNATCSYTMTETGTYYLRVRVMDGNEVRSEWVNSANTVVTEKIKLNSVTPGKVSAFVGDTVTWTPDVSNGEGEKSYYYMLYKDGVSIKVWGWSTNATCSYTMTETGTYYLRVRVMDGNEVRSEWVNSANTVVTEKIKLNSVTPGKVSAFVGDTVTWTPSVSNGEGEKSYYYLLYKDGVLLKVYNWSAEDTCSYTMTETGTYYLRVRVMDGNEVRSEWVNSANTVVTEKIKLNSVTPGKVNAFVGDTVTWTPNVSNGEGEKSYYYMLYKDGASIKAWGWSTNATCSYTMTETGTYYLRVRVMDGNEVRSEWVNSESTEVVRLPLHLEIPLL